jgi:hypothetical protein
MFINYGYNKEKGLENLDEKDLCEAAFDCLIIL